MKFKTIYKLQKIRFENLKKGDLFISNDKNEKGKIFKAEDNPMSCKLKGNFAIRIKEVKI